MRPRAFTTVELLLTIGLFAVMVGMVSLPLATLLKGAGIREAETLVIDTLRRAQTQAMAGHRGDAWGVHFSDADGCVLPAVKMHVFRGAFFTSATDTIETIDLPAGVRLSAVSVGGGCDVKYSRFHGYATTTGTVSLQNDQNQSVVITFNAYGRVAP